MNIFQALEQLSASLRDTAPILKTYHNDLKKQGFTENQAFALVKELQKSLYPTNK